jgi:hypothetical protein
VGAFLCFRLSGWLSLEPETTADPSTHHPQAPPQRTNAILWGPRAEESAWGPCAQDDGRPSLGESICPRGAMQGLRSSPAWL